MAKPAKVAWLENRLADFAGRRHCVLVGHANTALYLLLQHIKEIAGPGDVIMPPIVCPSVMQVVQYAGFQPVFADVSLPDCTLSPERATEEVTERTRAVLPVHIFGRSAAMPRFVDIGRQHGFAVIEDAAQSLGGVIAGRRHGAWGDASLISFGRTKVLAAGGGGALLTDDASIAEHVRELVAAIPPLLEDRRLALLALSHRNLTHGLMDLLRVDPTAKVADRITPLLDRFRDLYLHAIPVEGSLLQRIAVGLETVEANIAHRAALADQFAEGLHDLDGVVLYPSELDRGGVTWRYTLLVRDPFRLLEITAALRREHLHASNHYWSVAQLFFDRTNLRNAGYASPRLLNLWVDEQTSREQVGRAIDIIRSLFT